jgi:hypothetical protein
MRTILLNFMLKVGEGAPIPEVASKKLIEWADQNKMKRRSKCRQETHAGGADATRRQATPLVQHQGLETGLLVQQALEIMGIVFLRFLCRSEHVVEIAPLRASKFNRPQQHPSKNHKDLRVGNLVPNRVQSSVEMC